MGAEDLLGQARLGDRRALAKALSTIERGGADARDLGRTAFGAAGGAWTVGITGAPGAGKSTLTNSLIASARRRGERIAVLAIDPSSPFTGGALLGDRTRMNDHALDDGVFIRSMATRGHLGGLALTTPEAVRVLDAAGFGWILVETVGVGQVEVDIAGAADTTVVVVNPGWGDSVQANKAGLMEIADVFVVNKADRPGASETAHDLEAMLDLTRGAGSAGWRPPIVPAVGTTGEGADEIWDAVAAHRAHQGHDGRIAARRADRLRDELELVVLQRLRAEAASRVTDAERRTIEDDLVAGRIDPWSAADRILGTDHP